MPTLTTETVAASSTGGSETSGAAQVSNTAAPNGVGRIGGEMGWMLGVGILVGGVVRL